MKVIAFILLFINLLAGCAMAHDNKSCIISKSSDTCDDFALCKATIESLENAERNERLASKIISKGDFSFLLENIAIGRDCAIDLGFSFFNHSLSNSDAEYLEELSIALSYSIENNAIMFVRYMPEKFIEHEEILISLSCSVNEEFRENREYIHEHLEKRMALIRNIKEAGLIKKGNAIYECIQDYLKTYYK